MRLKGGIIGTSQPSNDNYEIHQDHHIYDHPLPNSPIQKKFIRNTNVTGNYSQIYSNCYSISACCAYIQAILQTCGSRPPPSIADCYPIAEYNKCGGDPLKSLQRLEDHFKYGIRFDKVDKITIRDAITMTHIACFSTTSEGWEKVIKGELIQRPTDESNPTEDGHLSVLVEGYDLENDYLICKNWWSQQKATPRFNFRISAATECYFIRVYSTAESTLEATGKKLKLIQNLETFDGSLNGKNISCAWMDEKTAQYCTNYVCELHPEKNGNKNYLGYEINQWIAINCIRDNKSH